MMDIKRFKGSRFIKFAPSKDIIEWQEFVEGMILRYILEIKKKYYGIHGLGRHTTSRCIHKMIASMSN